MDSSGAVQIAQNSGSTIQTAKAEPILEGRGWTVQRNVLDLSSRSFDLMEFEREGGSTWACSCGFRWQMGDDKQRKARLRRKLFAPAQPPGPTIPSDLPSWASKSCSKARIQLGASKSAVVSGHSLWNPAGEMLPVSESFLYWMFLPTDGRTVLSKEPERVVRLSEAPARSYWQGEVPDGFRYVCEPVWIRLKWLNPIGFRPQVAVSEPRAGVLLFGG
ncbi:hypothetical protein DFH09DRAFT_1083032 [Mycena vulgaris]|nr:hypothetical protein DFH09DRAFT_1083032 [Mycena vulgaris]